MRRSVLDAAATGAVFVGALLASLRANGISPIAWTDTFSDDLSVRLCVSGDSCTLAGTATSVGGFVHPVTWFELRSLLGSLGLDLDGTHVVTQILNALAVALVFAVARRIGGSLAGILAAVAFWFGFASLGIVTAAVYNGSPLGFLGAIFALSCIAVANRPGPTSVALAAMVAAILANVHLACVLAGVSVIGAALLAPRHRIALVIFGALVFASATFLIAPPAWIHNAATLFHRRAQPGNAAFAPRLEGLFVIAWLLLGVGLYLLSLRSSSDAWARCRRYVNGTFVVTLPFVLVAVRARLPRRLVRRLRRDCEISRPHRRRLRHWYGALDCRGRPAPSATLARRAVLAGDRPTLAERSEPAKPANVRGYAERDSRSPRGAGDGRRSSSSRMSVPRSPHRMDCASSPCPSRDPTSRGIRRRAPSWCFSTGVAFPIRCRRTGG